MGLPQAPHECPRHDGPGDIVLIDDVLPANQTEGEDTLEVADKKWLD
jgi:hypothetical protein